MKAAGAINRPALDGPCRVGHAAWAMPRGPCPVGLAWNFGKFGEPLLEIPEIPDPPGWKIRTSGVPKRCSQIDFPLFFEIFHSFGA